MTINTVTRTLEKTDKTGSEQRRGHRITEAQNGIVHPESRQPRNPEAEADRKHASQNLQEEAQPIHSFSMDFRSQS